MPDGFEAAQPTVTILAFCTGFISAKSVAWFHMCAVAELPSTAALLEGSNDSCAICTLICSAV